MKISKFLLLASVLAGGLLTACNDDGYWDEANKADLGLTGAGTAYTFNNSSYKYTYEPSDKMDKMTFPVVITRGTTQGDETLNLFVSSTDEELLVGDSQATFKNGENQATVYVTALRDFEIGESASVNFQISPESTAIPVVEMPDDLSEDATAEDSLKYDQQMADYQRYVNQMALYKLSATVNVAKDYNWTSLGYGSFSDWWMFEYNPYSVEIQQCVQDEHMFRLVNPYAEGLRYEGYYPNYYNDGPTENVIFRVMQPGDQLFDTTITLNDLVYYDDYRTGYYHTSYEAEVWACHPAGGFKSTPTEDTWVYNRVLSYQEDGTPAMVQFAPFFYMFGVGGWNYSQQDGVITIAFPGVYVADYSCAVSYTGLFTNPDNEQFVIADVELGVDVDHAWAVVVEGKDNVQDAFNGLADESITPVVVTESGSIQIPMIPNAATGKYSVVVFTFDEEGETVADFQSYDYATFNFVGGEAPETWTPSYVGTYTYSQFFEGDDEGLVLYESDSVEGRYKITDWGYGVDFIFQMNEDGTIMVEDQYTGYDHSSYGPVYVDDLVDYTGGTEQGYSYYDGQSGTFHFAVIYYVSAGYFGYGEETFTLTGYYSEAKDKAPSKIKPFGDVTTKTCVSDMKRFKASVNKWNVDFSKVYRVKK